MPRPISARPPTPPTTPPTIGPTGVDDFAVDPLPPLLPLPLPFPLLLSLPLPPLLPFPPVLGVGEVEDEEDEEEEGVVKEEKSKSVALLRNELPVAVPDGVTTNSCHVLALVCPMYVV